MTGQELMKLQDSNVFRPAVMDSIVNEFVPPPDAFVLTNAFLPFKLVEREIVIDLINHGAFGKTYPVSLGGDHRRIAIPGYEYRQNTPGHWRESVSYGEDVLQRAVDPSKPTSLWGEGLAAAALNLLDLRLNTLIEYLTSKIVVTGSYSEARHGINYTYDPKLPAKYYRNVTSTPGWTSGGTWATAASATPVTDIIQAVRTAKRYGMNVTSVMMTMKTALDFVNSTEAQNKIKASFQLVGLGNDPAAIFKVLVGFPLTIDERFYAEETRFTVASAVNDTTLDVESAAEFTAADIITLRNAVGEEEEATISSISSNTITISSGVVKAYAVGDRVTVYKRFLPDNYVILAATNNDRVTPNNWISTPSLIKAQTWKNPMPGRYTWNYFETKVPYKLEIGAGISGGPKVVRPNWMTIKTVA